MGIQICNSGNYKKVANPSGEPLSKEKEVQGGDLVQQAVTGFEICLFVRIVANIASIASIASIAIIVIIATIAIIAIS